MRVALGDILAKGDAATVQLAFAQEEELGGFFEEESGDGGGGRDNDTATQPDDNQTETLTNQTTGQTDGNTTQAPMPEFIEICDNDLDNDDDNLVDLDDPGCLSVVSANQTNIQNNNNNNNNSAPVAYDQFVQATMNTPVDITLFGSDADNNSLTATIDQSPSNGTLSEINQETGVVSYTPKPDFSGQDCFTYKVNDGIADSNPATVSITVNSGESGSNIGSSELSTTYYFSEVTFEGNHTWNSGRDKFKLNTSGSFHPISSLLGGPEDFTALALFLLLFAQHPSLIHSL